MYKTTSNISKLLLFCFIISFAVCCKESEAQQDFEQEARQGPSGITTMSQGPCRVNDDQENDPSDWRTAPDFSGLFDVITPACPNPVSFNENFRIEVDVFADAVNGLYIYAFQYSNDLTLLRSIPGTLPPGTHTFQISPQEFASSTGTGTFGNVYRIIMLDQQETVVTYGDVRVE